VLQFYDDGVVQAVPISSTGEFPVRLLMDAFVANVRVSVVLAVHN